MRLIDFLVLMLEAHAETLKRLAAFFGEEEFLEMLESAETTEPAAPPLDLSRVPFPLTGNRLPTGARSPYVELEGAVRELGLPAVLEFHLWAYPHYRAFIESDLDLGSSCDTSATPDGAARSAALSALIEQSVAEARQWAQKLPIPPSVAMPAETAAQVPWIRFRSQAFRKMGLRPMETIRVQE